MQPAPKRTIDRHAPPRLTSQETALLASAWADIEAAVRKINRVPAEHYPHRTGLPTRLAVIARDLERYVLAVACRSRMSAVPAK